MSSNNERVWPEYVWCVPISGIPDDPGELESLKLSHIERGLGHYTSGRGTHTLRVNHLSIEEAQLSKTKRGAYQVVIDRINRLLAKCEEEIRDWRGQIPQLERAQVKLEAEGEG